MIKLLYKTGEQQLFYSIQQNLSLQGWTNLTSCLTSSSTGTLARPLSNREFALLILCNGTTDISKDALDQTDQNLLDQFLQAGIIKESAVPAPIAPEQQYRKYDNRYFSSIFWSITGKCNYRCRHCYMDAPDGKLGELTLDEVKDIVDQIYDCGIRSFDFTGGEPFIRNDFWEIVDYILSRGMRINKIYTNGWLLDEKVIKKFQEREMKPAISISFDGVGWHDWMRRVKGAEDRAVEALKTSLEAGLATDVEMCVHRGNLHTVRETVNFLASIGVPSMKVGAVVNTPLWLDNAEGNDMPVKDFYEAALEYIPQFYEDGMPMNVFWGGAIFLNRHSKEFRIAPEKASSEERSLQNYLCGAARFNAYITPDGRFLPCMSITSVDAQKQFPLIRELGVKKCMSDSYYMNFVGSRVKDLFDRNTKCANCEYRTRCCGGCRALAMLENDGDLYASDPEACMLFQEGYVDRFRETAEMAIKNYC